MTNDIDELTAFNLDFVASVQADGQQAHGRYTGCWAKQNGKWLAVLAHATR
jgi:hypothetical protein